MKFFIILFFTLLVVVAGRPGCPGCVNRLTGDRLKEAESVLIFSLDKLADREDGPCYRLVRVNSATTQIVAGIRHVINADLIDKINQKSKTCRITIWSQPWMPNGTEVNFECPGEEKITRRHGS